MDSLALLKSFTLDRILNQEPDKCRLTLLGILSASWSSLQGQGDDPLPAIIRLEKTAFSADTAHSFFSEITNKINLVESTDIYTWLAAWTKPQAQGDVKVNVICPATEVHIKKYTKQRIILVQETPFLYETITKPYILAFPAQRTRWVTGILAGRSEQDKLLFGSPDFVILPDMKWDLHTIESLYILAIARDTMIRSLRDLKEKHIELLKSIRQEAYKAVETQWGLGKGTLRMFIHYQPSYYHFHVHIVHADYEVGLGAAVGQAHLLDDVISLLEVDGDIFEKMTLTYGIGDQHGLYAALKGAQETT
ncbi:scavenger mRNA decapping enzyme [Mycena floridula]|nr:scavenger mRNA decapping enzyme [Mycena floridula]